MTNEGFGYSFNMANFWDIFSKISFNRVFADIMRPKGYDQEPSPSELDENDETQRWVYPKFGVEFPKVIHFIKDNLCERVKQVYPTQMFYKKSF